MPLKFRGIFCLLFINRMDTSKNKPSFPKFQFIVVLMQSLILDVIIFNNFNDSVTRQLTNDTV